MVNWDPITQINGMWNEHVLNEVNAKALTAIANHQRRLAFQGQGRERGAEPPTPTDHERNPYSTTMNSGAILTYDSGARDFANSGADSVATVHTLVSKLIENEEIVEKDDRDALIQLSKLPLSGPTGFATIYPAEYNRLLDAGLVKPQTPVAYRAGEEVGYEFLGPDQGPMEEIPAGGGIGGELSADAIRGGGPTPELGEGGAAFLQQPVDRAGVLAPAGSLLDNLNQDQIPPATWSLLEGVAVLGQDLKSYKEWRIQHSKPPNQQSQAEYQHYLLEKSYTANVNKKVSNYDDLVYFTWDPTNEDAAPTLVRGEDDIKAIDEDILVELKEAADTKGFTEPTVGASGRFADTTFSQSELGAQFTAKQAEQFEKFGISVPPESLVWTMSYGTLQAIPNLARAEGATEILGGFDLNQVSDEEMLTMFDRLAREQGLPQPVAELVDAFRENPEEYRSTVGIAAQELAEKNSIADTSFTANIGEFLGPADYTFDVDVAEGWTDPTGWSPTDGTGATYSAVRAGATRTTMEWDYAPGQVPSGREVAAPGYQMTVPYTTGTTIKSVIEQVGGAANLWGSPEIMGHLFQVAANRDIPQQVALAFLHSKTNGFTDTYDPASAMDFVTENLDQLSTSMLRYGNPALAVIDQLFPDVASTLQTVGWLDPNHAALISAGFTDFMDLAHAFPGDYDDLYFKLAQQALASNAGIDPGLTEIRHEDPLKVKDALRDTFEALLMPVDDAVLDSFVSQFNAAENAAQQPLTNAYNRIVSENRDVWESLNTSVTPNVGAYDWLFPVAGTNSYGNSFGADRSGHSHGGIDIMANFGTPIVAPVGGKIVSVGTAGANGTGNAGGNRIHLLGNDGILYYFAHNAYNAVSSGDTVGAGETIGLVGNTGNAYKGGSGAPHLHFEMHGNGQFNSQNYNPGEGDGRVNPFSYLEAAQESGATVVSPWDTNKWQGMDIEAAARASAAGGDQTISITMPDLVARARQAARDTPMYQDLFGEKPVGISDVDYASAFAGTAATLAGAPAPEAARIGAATDSMDALYGTLLSDTDMADSSTTFRGRLFEMSNAFVEAMGGRP